MSASGDRVKDLLEHISDALALDADVVVDISSVENSCVPT